MAERVEIVAALRGALASYLAATLGPSFPGLQVNEAWPEPGATLPELAITVLVPTAPRFEMHPPTLLRTIPDATVPGNPATGTAIYEYGAVVADLQLDVWARYRATRDALAAALSDATYRSIAATLALSDPRPRYGRGTGLVLDIPLCPGGPSRAEYKLGNGALLETEQSVQQGEWRATWTGSVYARIVDAQPVTLLSSIVVTTTINGAAVPPRSVP